MMSASSSTSSTKTWSTAKVLVTERRRAGRRERKGEWLVGANGEYAINKPYLPSPVPDGRLPQQCTSVSTLGDIGVSAPLSMSPPTPRVVRQRHEHIGPATVFGGMAEELRKEWTVKSHVTHFPTERWRNR
jgi:hypothetical protein